MNKKYSYLCIFCLFLFSASEFIYYRNFGGDDAYIVFRIVRNILDGLGWHYNPGEMVNPSTSVLNTVLITVFAGLIGNIPIAGHLVSALSIFGTSVILFLMLRRETSTFLSLLGGIGIIFCRPSLSHHPSYSSVENGRSNHKRLSFSVSL